MIRCSPLILFIFKGQEGMTEKTKFGGEEGERRKKKG
jgi:hypothetical protein